ncbi:hypothetical protein NQ117_06700 [Paenibacillus sp. SC116]|uniref:hypothetical protein n=1 Tax=Paenibacillus sp. SC116 TaxID=2968986 RepID=UPI00215A8D1B|nr:hypothetical protein [Paenibacillus sp. SC116]MCR8843367.1 hypothetical protein [Paenibacillus sp. SC116]
MYRLEMRPDFVTAGAEAIDILIDGIYTASLLVMYREGSRLCSTLIIDEDVLSSSEIEQQLEQEVERYIDRLSDALDAEQRELQVINGKYSRIVSSSVETSWEEEWDHEQEGYEIDDEYVIDDEYQESHTDDRIVVQDSSTLKLAATNQRFQQDRRNHGNYHELAICPPHPSEALGIQIILARDDGDALLYDIYTEQGGSLPVGLATINTEGEQLSGFIDFRVPGTGRERHYIGESIVHELAKEQSFTALHLNMMFRDEIIDDALFYVGEN